MKTIRLVALALALSVASAPAAWAQAKHTNTVIDLWMQGKAVFGIYAPNEAATPRGPGGPGAPGGGVRPPATPPVYTVAGGEKLAMNPLYDFIFLNLEGSYDPAAVKAMAEGIRSPKAIGRKTLIVRIPPIDRDGAAATKARVKEILDAGADGVTIPHITSLDEAKLALSFFSDAKANVWSPSNPKGEKLAMLMLEDPKAVAQAREVADLKGISILACGIGSLAQAMGGDRAGAEAGTLQVLGESKRVKVANMLTANAQDIEKRVKQGFLALLMQGASADDTIKIGRAAAGR
ncbi:MAG: aldolase/citrate lyase family protein [Vicinamibacterales bacterium]